MRLQPCVWSSVGKWLRGRTVALLVLCLLLAGCELITGTQEGDALQALRVMGDSAGDMVEVQGVAADTSLSLSFEVTVTTRLTDQQINVRLKSRAYRRSPWDTYGHLEMCGLIEDAARRASIGFKEADSALGVRKGKVLVSSETVEEMVALLQDHGIEITRRAEIIPSVWVRFPEPLQLSLFRSIRTDDRVDYIEPMGTFELLNVVPGYLKVGPGDEARGDLNDRGIYSAVISTRSEVCGAQPDQFLPVEGGDIVEARYENPDGRVLTADDWLP